MRAAALCLCLLLTRASDPAQQGKGYVLVYQSGEESQGVPRGRGGMTSLCAGEETRKPVAGIPGTTQTRSHERPWHEQER